MQKRFSSWIRKSLCFALLSIITTGLAVLGCATVAVAEGGNTASWPISQLMASNPKPTTPNSIWENNIEPNLGTQEITVYRSPSCGCCGSWVKHMQKHGFQIKDIKTDEIEAIKQKYNLPQELASCHTAIIDGYVMEGHIPANDIKRFLQQKPTLAGLAVPGMPVGTPGMEVGNKKQPFAVVAFNNKGEVKLFQEYQSY
ncbi:MULTISPECIES: DUF411 domain-containing protein [Nostocales]|uniref:DUF411 domain-containing protein n=3 Tax=Nostocales TaxID=1161 RepID=A0A0C1NHX0_9CYAN|nr:DUF411 domain-containing protein [Tolypothrix bouteillei]KAF3890220.1 DUF411 domain-containing protein [Tolypothrix bouteillei VB521301]